MLLIKSFDTVDRGILDKVLSSLRLPGWFRNAYYEPLRVLLVVYRIWASVRRVSLMSGFGLGP